MAIAILFNLGALIMTNMHVVRSNPTIELREANPIQVKQNDFKPVEQEQVRHYMGGYLIQVFEWTFLIGAYLIQRRGVRTGANLNLLILIVIFTLVATTLDFSNDLGYTLGKLIYG